MGVQTCGACGGRGFTTESQWRPEPAGGMGRNVTIRRNCNPCRGSGGIRTPGPPRPARPRKPKKPRGQGKRGGKKSEGERIGIIGIGPEGERQVPITPEERAEQRVTGAAGMLAMVAGSRPCCRTR